MAAKLVEYLATTRLGERGTMTLPKEYRDALKLARISQLVLAEAVKDEVEENILVHAAKLGEKESSAILDDYTGLIRLTTPEIVPYQDEAEVLASHRLIAHEADVPVLLSAMYAKPDWLLTHNTKHFTQQVAKKSGLRIATPAEFFIVLSEGINSPI